MLEFSSGCIHRIPLSLNCFEKPSHAFVLLSHAHNSIVTAFMWFCWTENCECLDPNPEGTGKADPCPPGWSGDGICDENETESQNVFLP